MQSRIKKVDATVCVEVKIQEFLKNQQFEMPTLCLPGIFIPVSSKFAV